MNRSAAALVVAALAAAGVSVVLAWFRADVPGRSVTFAAVEVAPMAWLVPAAAAAAVVMLLAAIRAGAGGRGLGFWALGASLVAFGAAVTAVFAHGGRAVPEGVDGAPAAPLVAQPVAAAAIGMTALAVAVLFGWLAATAPSTGTGGADAASSAASPPRSR